MPIALDLTDKALLVRLGAFLDIMTLCFDIGL